MAEHSLNKSNDLIKSQKFFTVDKIVIDRSIKLFVLPINTLTSDNYKTVAYKIVVKSEEDIALKPIRSLISKYKNDDYVFVSGDFNIGDKLIQSPMQLIRSIIQTEDYHFHIDLP